MPVNKSQGDGYCTCLSGFFVALHIEEVPVARPPIFCLFVHINIAVQGVLGNAEIIGNFIPGLGDQESTGIVEELDRSNFVLLVHKCDRFADQSNRFR